MEVRVSVRSKLVVNFMLNVSLESLSPHPLIQSLKISEKKSHNIHSRIVEHI